MSTETTPPGPARLFRIKPLDFQWNKASKSWKASHPTGDFEIILFTGGHQLWCFHTNGHASTSIGFESCEKAVEGAERIKDSRLLPCLEPVEAPEPDRELVEAVKRLIAPFDESGESDYGHKGSNVRRVRAILARHRKPEPKAKP